jgi:hypothetical protein
MTRWDPTTFEDLHRLHLQVSQLWQDPREAMVGDERTRRVLRENSRTLWAEDRALAVIGVSQLWRGVGAAFALLSYEAVEEHPIALARGTRRWLDWIVDHGGYWRIQATVEQQSERARDWLVWLGFRFEGTMWGYGPLGTDHDMYAKLVPRGTGRT